MTKQGHYIWPAEWPSGYTKTSSKMFQHTEYVNIDLSQNIQDRKKDLDRQPSIAKGRPARRITNLMGCLDPVAQTWRLVISNPVTASLFLPATQADTLSILSFGARFPCDKGAFGYI